MSVHQGTVYRHGTFGICVKRLAACVPDARGDAEKQRKARFLPRRGRKLDYTLCYLGTLACYYLGIKSLSLEFAQAALQMNPDDPRLKSNYEIIKSAQWLTVYRHMPRDGKYLTYRI